MRPHLLALPALALTAAPALAADVGLGVDADVGFALGNQPDLAPLEGPGGGLGVRFGVGPNPLALGPSALSILVEATGSFWRFPDVEEGPTDLIRAGLGGRFIFTLLWIRAPADEGGRGRGIRLDLPLAVHGGLATLDEGGTLLPTGDASVGLSLGLLPVEIGLHVGVGGLTGAETVDPAAPSGVAWLNAGLDIGAVF